MKKVFVIGPSGAGKSTFAAALAEKLNVPHTELDSIFHQPNWVSIDTEEFRKIMTAKTQEDGWVFCGNYFGRLGADFWKKADAVIWLDYPFLLVLWRLIVRTFKRGIHREELWNGNRESIVSNLFTKDSVIYFMIGHFRSQRRRYNAFFANPTTPKSVRLIHLKSPADADAFLKMTGKSPTSN